MLHLDFESASIVNLKTQGLDRYVRDVSTKVLMLGWAFDEDEPEIWEPRLGAMPKEVCAALRSDCELAAWNSSFERNVFRFVLNMSIPIERWVDPSTYARHLSLPGGLQDVSTILGLGDDAKDKEGKRLIKKFCMPPFAPPDDLPTLFGPGDWGMFKEYCKQDVRAERKALTILEPFRLPPMERKVWCLDQKINDRGLPAARSFAQKASKLAGRSKEEFKVILGEKTRLENPNSNAQMLKWLGDQDYGYGSIEKSTITTALTEKKITPLAREVLELRKEASKNSHKKLARLLENLSEDDRLRNQFVYLGAARTGRWSGHGVQFQNLPRPIKEVENNLDRAIVLIESEDYDTIKKEYPSVIGMAVSCIRSVFRAPTGKKLIVCDLSAIENRVIGWLSNCHAILQVFYNGLDPYVSFAVKMYNQPYERLLADKAKRQIAKPAVLGAGFGLGPGVKKVCAKCRRGIRFSCKRCRTEECNYEAVLKRNKAGDLKKTGLLGYAENMGVVMTPQQAFSAQRTFRQSYPEVVAYWDYLEEAATEVITNGGEVRVGVVEFSRVELNGRFIMRIFLPSGRSLHYVNAAMIERELEGADGEPYKKTFIMYDGIGHGVGTVDESDGGRGSKWGPVYTYGGKLCENVVQAIARDILAYGMLLADEDGAEIVGHVHDECIVLADDDPFSFGLEDLKRCMSVTPPWAEGLPLAAEGYEGQVYRKN